MHLTQSDNDILNGLTEDGRITVQDLADRVGMSASSCWRRVRDLETSGVITGYRATLDPAACGLGFHAIVFAEIDTGHPTAETVGDAIVAIDGVVEAWTMSGPDDIALRILAADQAAFSRTLADLRRAAPALVRMRTSLVTGSLKTLGRLPLGA